MHHISVRHDRAIWEDHTSQKQGEHREVRQAVHDLLANPTSHHFLVVGIDVGRFQQITACLKDLSGLLGDPSHLDVLERAASWVEALDNALKLEVDIQDFIDVQARFFDVDHDRIHDAASGQVVPSEVEHIRQVSAMDAVFNHVDDVGVHIMAEAAQRHRSHDARTGKASHEHDHKRKKYRPALESFVQTNSPLQATELGDDEGLRHDHDANDRDGQHRDEGRVERQVGMSDDGPLDLLGQAWEAPQKLVDLIHRLHVLHKCALGGIRELAHHQVMTALHVHFLQGVVQVLAGLLDDGGLFPEDDGVVVEAINRRQRVFYGRVPIQLTHVHTRVADGNNHHGCVQQGPETRLILKLFPRLVASDQRRTGSHIHHFQHPLSHIRCLLRQRSLNLPGQCRAWLRYLRRPVIREAKEC
mmetsp:Transcript_3923/g.9824  ORF Transcript_3923/g.9824 Transcript_3923/m.9824 type:complete len:415 (+) Transcript_3923:389-1633(+)